MSESRPVLVAYERAGPGEPALSAAVTVGPDTVE